MVTKAADREHAKTYRSPFGRWDVGAPEFMRGAAAVDGDDIADHAPLRTVAAAQGAALRVAQGTLAPRTSRVAPAARAAARDRAQAFVAANAQPRRPMQTMQATPSRASLYAQADRAAGAVPAGRYALPRVNVTAAGNDLTFFEVVEFKTGPRKGAHRIFQLISNGTTLVRQSFDPKFQIYAAMHIAEDVAAAAGLFGRTIGICAFGPHPLTNARSRAAGYGETCAKNHGLPW